MVNHIQPVRLVEGGGQLGLEAVGANPDGAGLPFPKSPSGRKRPGNPLQSIVSLGELLPRNWSG
jgi:hypothetical protein